MTDRYAKIVIDEQSTVATRPEVALIVSSYQKPRHLSLALASIAFQQGVIGKMELIVSDDGSTDETSWVVARFAKTVDFSVKFTTHPHQTFQLARCRNQGVDASAAAYILFLDGDCILPRDFVLRHLAQRRPGVVSTGDCFRLDEEVSARVDEDAVRSGAFRDWVSPAESRRLAKQDRKARLYSLIRHRSKPKLLGGNVGIWRWDFERVNGYDEDFAGWGCEDDDLGRRLRKVGLRMQSIIRWTRAYHLWHPRDTTAPVRWRDGANVRLLLNRDRPAYAVNGLRKIDEGTRIGAAEEEETTILPMRRTHERNFDESQQRNAA